MGKLELSPVHEWRLSHLGRLERQFGTLQKLADFAGVDASYLSQIKNRTRGMGAEFARKLEQGLGLDQGVMSRPTDESTSHTVQDEQPPYISEDEQLKRIIEAWPALTKSQRSEAVRNITGVERSNREIINALMDADKKAS